jgi:diguanylate cyclase (GGDEF)-like protein
MFSDDIVKRRTAADSGDRDPKRILVVDDEAHIREILQYQLENAGYLVSLAEGGEEALEVIRTDPPDLVLLDLMMPLVDGNEVCRQLRGDFWTSHIPVIMITAKGELEDKVEGLEDGANDYITKPFAIAEVLVRVRNALEWARAQRQANPLTGLPGNLAIAREIEARLKSDPAFAFVYADLDGFKAFNDHYGYCRGDSAISMTARVLTSAVKEFGQPGDFVGHIGGDDFVILSSADRVDALTTGIIERFDEEVRCLLDEEDRDRGYLEVKNRQGEVARFPLLAVTLAVVTNENGPIEHIAEVSDIASELKCFGKRQEGSVVVRERRGSWSPEITTAYQEAVPHL